MYKVFTCITRYGSGTNFFTIEEYVKLWILTFYQKENSPITLNRKGWISMSMPYLTSQQLSKYAFPK